MIVMGLLGAMASSGWPQGDRPSVLRPLSGLVDRARPHGDDAHDDVDPSCRLVGLEPGKPVPKGWRGEGNVRIIRPGDQVTMDFIESRRNIHLDQNGNVARITCG